MYKLNTQRGMTHSQVISLTTDYLKRAGLTNEQVDRLRMLGYFYSPASREHHLARIGGLALHSIHVTDLLLELRAFDDNKSAYKVGMLHDLVKCFTYAVDKDAGLDITGHEQYKKCATCYPGHGTASVFHISDLGIELTNEERQAILWHMGAFALTSRELSESYDQAKMLFPRAVVLTHAADNLAAALEDEEEEHG